jgi:hypothetical protein
MSSGDYVKLKKAKNLKNYSQYASKTYCASKPMPTYEQYIYNVGLDTARLSTATYGNGSPKPFTIDNVQFDPADLDHCPANNFDGVYVPRSFVCKSQYPLISTPSIPPKLQVVCSDGEKPCVTYFRANRAYYIPSKPYARQWNLKKTSMMEITDSTSFQM